MWKNLNISETDTWDTVHHLAFFTKVLVMYFLYHSGPSEELISLLAMVCESCKPLHFPFILSSSFSKFFVP